MLKVALNEAVRTPGYQRVVRLIQGKLQMGRVLWEEDHSKEWEQLNRVKED